MKEDGRKEERRMVNKRGEKGVIKRRWGGGRRREGGRRNGEGKTNTKNGALNRTTSHAGHFPSWYDSP